MTRDYCKRIARRTFMCISFRGTGLHQHVLPVPIDYKLCHFRTVSCTWLWYQKTVVFTLLPVLHTELDSYTSIQHYFYMLLHLQVRTCKGLRDTHTQSLTAAWGDCVSHGHTAPPPRHSGKTNPYLRLKRTVTLQYRTALMWKLCCQASQFWCWHSRKS